MSRDPVSAKPLSYVLRSIGHQVLQDPILALVKPKASAASTRPLPDSQRRHPTRGPAASLLQITIIGGAAIAIAVFGRPTQALAAAVIVEALCALTQGRSVTRSTASAVHTLLRALQGTNAAASTWPTRSAGDLLRGRPARPRAARQAVSPTKRAGAVEQSFGSDPIKPSNKVN
jgi:hypothetical protein